MDGSTTTSRPKLVEYILGGTPRFHVALLGSPPEWLGLVNLPNILVAVTVTTAVAVKRLLATVALAEFVVPRPQARAQGSRTPVW
jgi:hypothetical protein